MTGKTSANWELGAGPQLLGAVATALLVGLAGLGSTLAVAPAHAFQSDRERKSYRVSEFVLEYALDHPSHVDLEEILDLEVGLRSTERGFVAPRPVDRTYRMKLDSIPDDSRFYPSALQHINWFIVLSFSRLGIDGVFITVPDVEPGTGRDLRKAGNTTLRLRVWTGRIADIATVADGARFDDLTVEERTNHPAHEWMLALSPVQPGGDRDLLRVDELNDFAFSMSRHPGRRVDAELSAGTQPGTTQVTYRVAENRPLFTYFQFSNTGTEATSEWRQQFGFSHNQLTGRDDVLRFDYVTGNFDEVNGVIGAYEAPFTLQMPELRWGISGGWTSYDAQEVGFALPGFTGDDWYAGTGLTYTLLQRGQLFVDVASSLRWQYVSATNRALGTSSESDFFLPQVGVIARRDTSTSALRASLDLVGNLASVADTATGNALDELGRLDADDDFVILRWNGSWSSYLEPLLNRAAFEDPGTPESSTLAHEVGLTFRGQYAFNYRLIPQFQQVAGGLYTVRGYEQSAAAGDTVLIGSAEYRFHLPRIFRPDPTPPRVPVMGRFRTRPQQVYGGADWDLIFRVFADAAWVHASDALAFETNQTLASVGSGIELQILRNLSIRFDTGVVLSPIETSGGAVLADVGDMEFYVVGTLLY
jgi:hemolysin activation/secretion protein